MRPFAIAAILLLGAVPALAGGPPPSIGPEPTWVRILPTAEMMRHAPTVGRGNDQAVLVEEQVNRAIDPPETYHRYATRALNEGGVPPISQISCLFNPAFETLRIHRVVIHRGAEDIPVEIAGRLKLLDRGERLGEQIYDGQTTAVLMLDDVRPGDIVDFSYTVRGVNPVLAGQFSARWITMALNSVGTIHDRLLWPAARPLRVLHGARTAAPTVTQRGDIVEYDVLRNDTPTYDFEASPPGWYDAGASIQFEDDTNWNGVARWATTLFRVPEKPSLAVLAKVQEFTRASGSSQARAMAAVRFVQDEIRYLGIEIGENSHRATDPGVVLTRRYGDCKDKALLLVTFLRQLGYDAEPALVNTMRRDSTGSAGASALEFDHAIVRVHDSTGGPGWWVDATESGQRGARLAQLALPPFGVALVVADTTRGLTKMSAESEPRLTTFEKRIVARDESKPATMELVSSYFGADANDMRVRMRGVGPDDLAKFTVQAYQPLYPRITSAERPVVTDDEVANRIRIEMHFTIPGFWTKGSGGPVGNVSAIELRDRIPAWRGQTRSMPLALPDPDKTIYNATIDVGRELPVTYQPERIEVGSLRMDSRASVEGGLLKSFFQLESGGGFVTAAEAPLASQRLAAMQAKLPVIITLPQGLRIPIAENPPDPVGMVLALMGLALGGVLAVRFYRGPDPAVPWLRPAYAAGTEPWNPGQPIGGWLYLLGIEVLATPFFVFVQTIVILGRAGASASAAAGDPAWAYGVALVEAVLSAVQCVAAILLVTLFLRRRRKFVPYCRVFMAVAVVALLIDSVRRFATVGDTELFRGDLAFAGVGAIAALVWSAYLRRSRRVEATFVD